MELFKELGLSLFIILSTSAVLKPEYTQTFDDGSLKTTKQACGLAIKEHLTTVNICKRNNKCLSKDYFLTKRLLKLENFTVNNCKFKVS